MRVLTGAGANSCAKMTQGIEESQAALGALWESKYSAHLQADMSSLRGSLSSLGDLLDLWLEVQRRFCSAEGVFAADDIARQLPQETGRFRAAGRALVALAHEAGAVKFAMVLLQQVPLPLAPCWATLSPHAGLLSRQLGLPLAPWWAALSPRLQLVGYSLAPNRGPCSYRSYRFAAPSCRSLTPELSYPCGALLPLAYPSRVAAPSCRSLTPVQPCDPWPLL